MKKISIVAAAGLLASGITFAASAPMAAPAAPHSWYVGVGASYNSDLTLKNTNTNKIDANNVGWNVFGGYRFAKYFGAELGYNYFGTTTMLTTATTKNDIDAWDIYLNGTAYLPICRYLEAYAQGGIAYLQMNDDQNHTTSQNSLKAFLPDYAFGLQFSYAQFGARVYYKNFIRSSAQDIDLWQVPASVGLDIMYAFG
jgi:hypothetical protein